MAIRRASGARLLLGLALAATPLLAAGCSTEESNVHTARNPMISFTGYRTFTMSAGYAPRGYETSPRGAEVQRRLQPLVAQALNQRGYVEATTERPDFVVLIGSGRRVVSQNQSADNIGSPSWLPDDENLDFVEGAVVIDAFDGKTAAQIWHGASQARIDPDHIDDALLQKTVAQLISGFPRAAHEVH